jgi:hypothetical protein
MVTPVPKNLSLRFQILTSVNKKISVFWEFTPFTVVKIDRLFWRLHTRRRENLKSYSKHSVSSILNIRAHY